MENEIETGMSQAYLRFRAFRVRKGVSGLGSRDGIKVLSLGARGLGFRAVGGEGLWLLGA